MIFYCPVVITKRFFTTECNICSSHKVNIPALQSAGKLHKGKLSYLITSPGDKVILELVKSFNAFVGLLQRISNSIIYTSLCIVRNCTADTPIPSSSLFAQRADTQHGCYESDVTQYIIMRFQSLLCSIIIILHRESTDSLMKHFTYVS